ncbi:MAG: glycosyltransferase family 4 protein [Bacteroidales bacterium]|nr:glycosyltransferase family 4 protein [Bacteroidales bacterium]
MKIVYCSTPSFADSDVPLINALCNSGNEVFYFVHIAPYSLKATLIDINNNNAGYGIFSESDFPEIQSFRRMIPKARLYLVNNPVGKNNLKALRLSVQEASAISAINPDVIHYIESPAPYHLPLLWANRKKVVCTIHDPVPHLNKMRFTERICRKLSAKFIRKFVVLNKRQSEGFCKLYNVPVSSIRYAELGPYNYYTTSGQTPALPYKYVLMFGRITPYKGFEYGVRAFNSLPAKYDDIHLVMAGAGDIYFDESEYKNNRNITVLNRYLTQDEQVSLFQNALFVLCPYTEATQSGVVQTAFGLGVPVVVTKVGALADCVEDGVTGYVVNEVTQEAINFTIQKVLSEPAKLDEMRENVKRSNDFGAHSWGNIAQKYLAIYNGEA